MTAEEGSTAETVSGQSSTVHRERRIDLFTAVLLAIATVATAWSSYQSARWSGVQAIDFSRSNAARVEANRAAARADQLRQIDVSTFIAWAGAFATDDEELTDFYFKRFRTEFRPAVNAWIEARPLKNPDAPLTPFALPEYRLADEADAERLDARAASATEAAKDANQRSDNYVLAVVLFASSLFFAGISTKLASLETRRAILLLGYVVFVGTAIWVATFPVTVSL